MQGKWQKSPEGYEIQISSFKHLETTKKIIVRFNNENGLGYVTPDTAHHYTAKVANASGLVGEYQVKLDGNQFILSSADLVELVPDAYMYEIWETYTDDDGKEQTNIFPSPGYRVEFTVVENVDDATGKLVKTIDFKQIVQDTVNEYLKKHGGGTDDLSDYLKSADADKKFAAKKDIPVVVLDSESRKLTINGTQIDIPASVNLSDYVTREEMPNVTYDQSSKVLTVNGVQVELPSEVDLSGYLKTTDADQKFTPRGLATSLRVVTTNMKDIYYLFDNGSELHFNDSVKGNSGQLTVSGGYGNLLVQGWSWGNSSNNIASYLNGSLLLSEMRNHMASDFNSWEGCYAVNPIRDANAYDYSTAKIYKKETIGQKGEIDLIKSWYACGLFTEQQIESLGAVKK